MPRLLFILTLLFAATLFGACTSGQTVYNQGKYYEAAITAIQRLREAPNRKKAKQALAMAYPRAVERLEFDSKNAIETNASMRYRTLLQNYQKINTLYDEINKSPGALQVIPNPLHKHTELAAVKENAAEETYNAGMQAMLKNNREDAKKAYFLFKEVNSLSPGFKACIDMAKEAKVNATLRVLVEREGAADRNNDWNFESAIFTAKQNEFVQFYSSTQLEQSAIKHIDQTIRVIDKRFEKNSTFSQSSTSFSDSVKVGEKEVKGHKIPTYKSVKATLMTFTKIIAGTGTVTLVIIDKPIYTRISKHILHQDIVSEVMWSDSWARYTGDVRALSRHAKRLCDKKEPYMPRNYLYREAKKSLDIKVRRQLESFYRNY